MFEHTKGHRTSGGAEASDAASRTTLVVPTGRIACDGCRAIVEERLRRSLHVTSVEIDAERKRHGSLSIPAW